MMYYLIIALGMFSNSIFAMNEEGAGKKSTEDVRKLIQEAREREHKRQIDAYKPREKNKLLEQAINDLNSAVEQNDIGYIAQQCHAIAAAAESNHSKNSKKYTLIEVRQLKKRIVPTNQSDAQQNEEHDDLIQCLEDADNGIIREEYQGDAIGNAN